MKRLALATIVVLLATLPTQTSAQPSDGPTLPLDHAGRWITDADGRVVILHGVNEVNKRSEKAAPILEGFGDDDAAFLAGEGFNAVRVGLYYRDVEPKPGVYDDAYLDQIASTVDTLAAHGIVSLLDFHQDMYNQRFQGDGFPDWATKDNGLPAEPRLGFPFNYTAMPALWRAYDLLYANSTGPNGVGLRDSYAAAWAHVAERFADHPAVVGYDLMNEPWPGSLYATCIPLGCPVLDATLRKFWKTVTAAIRKVDPTTMVWYEPFTLTNQGVPTHLGDMGDDHSGMSFHSYCLTDSVPEGMRGLLCEPFDELVFANAETQSRVSGDALMLTEFGASDRRDILEPMVRRADAHMVSWLEWAYNEGGVRDLRKPPVGDNVNQARWDMLAEPYPKVVAGTPISYGFDPTSRTFTLAYSTTRADGLHVFGPGALTEIALPKRQYPAGARVDVEGGRVVRATYGGVAIEALPGAEIVSVRVTP